MKEFTIDLHDGRGNQVYVLKIDQLAALAEKDENTVSCVDYKQLTCSLCTQQKKEIAALEAVVKERNLEWESIRGQNIRHATVNDELKERIAALTAERDRLREALEEIAPFLCRAICPTTWKTGEARPHDELCVLVQATLKGRVNNAGTMVEASME